VVTDFVGQPGYMSWEQLAAMRDAGMEIGSHTISHPDLTTLDAAELQRQVAGSKAELEARLGVRVVSFCYPSGHYGPDTVAAVRDAGYESATTTNWSPDYSDMLALPRRRVEGGTAAEDIGWIVAN
jgi:peptidoglycan/xylan/chitin deacetylase (PgdA/CDA1 family)